MREARIAPVESLQSAIAEAGFSFVPAAAMQPLLAAAGPLSDWEAFAASWNDLAVDTYMADGGRYRRRRHARLRRRRRGHRSRAASAALSEPRLQRAERWHRPMVRADHRGRRWPEPAHDPRVLPTPVRQPDVVACPLARRGAPVPHRGTAGHARPAHAGGAAPRRCRLRAGVVDQPAQHRERHDHHPCARRPPARGLHADRAVRRGPGRRRARLPRRDAGRARGPESAGVSRRPRRDVPDMS